MRNLIQSVLALAALLSVFFGGYFALITQVEAATDAGIAQLAPRVSELENRAKRNEEAERRLAADLHEVQLDVRELYKVIQTGARSPRLEAPLNLPDGGAP